jgi:hypothetical protein
VERHYEKIPEDVILWIFESMGRKKDLVSIMNIRTLPILKWKTVNTKKKIDSLARRINNLR